MTDKREANGAPDADATRRTMNGEPPADATTVEGATDRPTAQEQSMVQELEKERARAADFLEQAQRSRAELINFRRRTEQEMEQIRRFAGERLIRQLLPVLDDFQRAINAVPDNERDNAWIQGILLIERKLWSIIESEGVRPIEAVGKPFDPAVHEAVTVEEGVDVADTVVEEFQRGFTMHDQTIRPAMVKVGRSRTET